MDQWSLLSHVLGLAIGAGLNLYAAVLVTGLGIRFGWVTNLPGELSVLADPWILGAAGILYVAEFVADKIPGFTPFWDGVHTLIRPAGAALLALSATATMSPTVKVLAVLAAGTVALGTHTSKMGARLVAHTTPDPVTHSAISLAEDFGVAALLALAFAYPWIAVPVMLAIVAGIAMFLPMLLRIARFLLAGMQGRVLSWIDSAPRSPEPGRIRAFTRKAKGAPRFAAGWLDPETGRFTYRRWGMSREMNAGAVNPEVEWGFVYNVARTADGATFYLTKEWCAAMSSGTARCGASEA